ncbi:MAG TPA: serine/threonine-protein kinase [Candidatus Eisenbacteria bacterium]|nr:serine/threonine-protein kinase [Candidatus Eisenbacteria bacterium]
MVADLNQTVTTPAAGRVGDVASERFLPGAMIEGRYRIRGLIGVGGMGEVYHADDLRLGVSVALKFLNVASAGNPERLRALVDEVRAARQVAHPNVCRVFDLGDVDGLPFLTMEYVDGEDLQSLLRRVGRIPAPKLVELAHQLCAALAAAHQAGILHRDLKPANVMVDGRGVARIMDFGIAVPAAAAASVAGDLSGTPAYMAPEQSRGEPVGPQADLYALGMILYEAATGRRYVPIPDQPAIVPEVHPDLARAIAWCLERDPALRPASALEVAAKLPGGDLLEATLEAGGTPSPELVAVSGEARGLSARAAWMLFALSIAGLAAAIGLAGKAVIVNRLAMTKPPAVLVDRARETLERFAPGAARSHEAWGFEYDDRAFEQVLADRRGTKYWDSLRDVHPAPIRFWYRTSPTAITPSSATGGLYSESPPLDVPGMSLVVLDPDARVIQLRTVPGRWDDRGDAFDRAGGVDSTVGAAAPWPEMLAWTGFDPDSLRETAPVGIPPSFVTERRAWVGRWPGASGRAVRIEGSALGGSLVSFQASALERGAKATPPTGTVTPNHVGASIELGLYIVGILASTWLGFRNFRLGRVDRRGASRLAVLLAGLRFLGWVFGGPHVTSLAHEWEALLAALGEALRTGAIAWLLYVALEPYVRRRIPRSIITWSRVLSGRFRDPLVGRDLLFGVLAGEIFILLFFLDKAIPEWLGLPAAAHLVTPFVPVFNGVGTKLFALTAVAIYGIERSMVYLVVLLALVLLVKRPVWAGVAFVLLYAAMFTMRAGNPTSLSPLLSLAGVAVLAVLLTRYGLVASAVAIALAYAAQRVPVVSDLSAWSATSTWLFAAMVLLPGAWGAWVAARAVRRRGAFR